MSFLNQSTIAVAKEIESLFFFRKVRSHLGHIMLHLGSEKEMNEEKMKWNQPRPGRDKKRNIGHETDIWQVSLTRPDWRKSNHQRDK